MRELFPPELGPCPEPMRWHVEAIRRAARIRRIVDAVVGAVFYLCLLCVAAFMAWILAQAADRAPPTHVEDHIVTPRVAAGSTLVDRITVTEKHRSCELKIRWFIFDGNREIHIFELPALPASGLKIADRPFLRSFLIPAWAAPGPSTVRFERSYACPGNYLHKWFYPIVVTSPDYDFEILPRDAKMAP